MNHNKNIRFKFEINKNVFVYHMILILQIYFKEQANLKVNRFSFVSLYFFEKINLMDKIYELFK